MLRFLVYGTKQKKEVEFLHREWKRHVSVSELDPCQHVSASHQAALP